MNFWEQTWASVKRWLSFVGTKILGPVIAACLIVLAFVALTMGFKELQIGGLLGKLLGKKPDEDGGDTIHVANSVDQDRVSPDGKIITPGQPDSVGDTQAVVVPIKGPGLLSDPKTVVFTPPGATKPTTVVLPDGVTNRDVEQVVLIKPQVIAVTVKTNSGISTQRIEDLLKKYRR